MGQQQLLLVILASIVVGIAIAVGLNMFRASAIESARDAVAVDLEDLAIRAQAYYRKPRVLGGGDRTFTQPNGQVIRINAIAASDSNANGRYFIDSARSTAQLLVIVGQGYEVVGNFPIELEIQVTPDNATMQVIR